MDRITEGLVLVSTPTFLSAPNLKYSLQVPPKPFLAQASELSILGSERVSFIGLSTSVINSLTKSFPTVFKRRDGLDVPRRQIRRHPRSPPDFSPPCSRSIVKQTRTGVPLSLYPRPMFPGRNSACRRRCIQIWDPTLATCFHTVSSTLLGAITAAAAFGAPRSPAGFPPLVLAHPLDPAGDMCSVSNGLKTASSRGFGRQRFGTLALPA
ncbi:hypothetical protein C8J57DRAFT_1529494 [Mycena rebaudengoi]|nr:hypothetical protein C8J57DRAFT_1529494 [Mycena rebaudengoi]